MDINRTVGKGRRRLIQATAIGLPLAGGLGVGRLVPDAPASAEKSVQSDGRGGGPQTPVARVPLDGVDMAHTYVNPINLPGMAVRNIVGTMPPTDTNVADASQIPAS